MLKQREFVEAFGHLGQDLEVTGDLFKALERFVCFLYGFPKNEEVNTVRRCIFWDKFKKKKQVVDLSLLPPCRDNLHFHVMRSNYVAYIFRKADKLLVDIDDPTKHGWNEQMKVVWSSVYYPPDVSEFLFDMRSDDDSRSGHDVDDTTDLDNGNAWSFEDDLDDDLEDISLFD